MRGQGPADQPDPSSDRHDAAKDVIPVAGVQGALVQVVDLALDHLGELVVPDDDLVDEARQEIGGVESAETRLAVEGVVEAPKGRHRPGVDGEDDVPFRDEVDLATLEAGRIVIGRLERLKRQVEPVLRAGQLGAIPFGCESFSVGLGKVQQVRYVTQ
jgi:hypothetical protein